MMVSSRESFPKGRILYWICWGAILVLALLFRILPIRSGLPYSDYVDEGHVLHQTIDAFNNRSLDVYWYGLPALPAYCAGATLLSYGGFYHHFHGHRFQKDLPHERDLPTSKQNYDFIAPVELIVAGRMATACLSIASVILAGIFAARLANDHAGLLAMLLVAVCPALVTRASIVIVDTFATFFVLVVLYLCARIQAEASKPVWRDVALAGLATGLAFASKYPAATVGVAVITSILTLPVQWRRRLRLFFPAAGGFVLGILLGAPMTFLKPITVWRDIMANLRDYGSIHSPGFRPVQAISMFEFGVPLLARRVCRDHLDAAAKKNTSRRGGLDSFCGDPYCVVHGSTSDPSAAFCLSFRLCASRRQSHFLLLSTGRAEERVPGCLERNRCLNWRLCCLPRLLIIPAGAAANGASVDTFRLLTGSSSTRENSNASWQSKSWLFWPQSWANQRENDWSFRGWMRLPLNSRNNLSIITFDWRF